MPLAAGCAIAEIADKLQGRCSHSVVSIEIESRFISCVEHQKL
ncbi:hypothetical protein [Nostoc sp. NIES-3756]|nr:hypothetical protein [Nostoc sp. NIES-3756]